MDSEKDLIYWVPSFYVMEDLLVRFDPSEVSPSRTRLKRDILEARSGFSGTLSNLLFDVLVKLCFGEARHAHDRCGVVIAEIPQSMDRAAVYALSEMFDPRTSLPKLRDLFLECWLEPYGGCTWAVIAETAMEYRSVPSGVFIDNCVDLSHHGGLAFSKIETGFHVWHKRRYIDLLDKKSNASILDVDFPLPVFYFIRNLLERAYNLGVVDGRRPELQISEGYGYRPVRWGGKTLSDPRRIYDSADDKEKKIGSI